MNRDPLCHICRERHPFGIQTAYEDGGVLWCYACHRPLNADQECGHDDCCGWRAAPSLAGVRS